MEIVEKLNSQLLHGNLEKSKHCKLDIEVYKNIAFSYSQIENSMAVLSDMQCNRSFVYTSRIALELGMNFHENPSVINSIWEEEILGKIHPDDKLKKYIHELRFFTFLETLKINERTDYHVLSRMRMKDKDDVYRFIQHRMYYFYSPYNNKLRFALCLYNIALDQSQILPSDFLIVNSAEGKVVLEDRFNYQNILSKRELEVLKLVGEGFTSKKIADFLSISINTVSRHRQNILEKLNVKNSVEAFNEGLIK
jgi:DNA-binding CsgD family transcriptional regulator